MSFNIADLPSRDALKAELEQLEARYTTVREQLMEARKIVWAGIEPDQEVRASAYDKVLPLRELMFEIEARIDEINWILA